MSNIEKKAGNAKKDKVGQNDKYYKINADFTYLKHYNYRITKEIGRGGYGVVYKVIDNYNLRLPIQIITTNNVL